MLTIKTNLLTFEEQTYHWELSKSWVADVLKTSVQQGDLEAALYKPASTMQVDASIYEQSDGDYLFTMKVHGEFQTTCVRCLEENPYVLDFEVGGVLVAYKKGKEELEDPAYYAYHNEEINFTEALTENVFLNLPSNPSCEELTLKNCEMLSFEDAEEERIEEEKPLDPRWSLIAKIRSEMN